MLAAGRGSAFAEPLGELRYLSRLPFEERVVGLSQWRDRYPVLFDQLVDAE